MGPAISLAEHVDEIRLAAPRASGGFFSRLVGWIPGLGNRDRVVEATLRATESALSLRAEGRFENGVEIPWRDVRKLIVDDGTRWGYVSGVCRFPVYDLRPDGSGSGVLIGPLWSQAASLLPEGCPLATVDPVPVQAPNIAVILDPPSAVPKDGRQDGAKPEMEWIAVLLLRAADPEAACEALADRGALGDIGHDDLEYLAEAARRPSHGRRPSSGHQASAASA